MPGNTDREPPVAPAPAEILRRTIAAAYQLYAAQRYGEAAELCARVLRESPDQFDVLYLQAHVRYRASDRGAADALVERAFQVRPEVLRFDHPVGLLKQRGAAGWLGVHETRPRLPDRRRSERRAYRLRHVLSGMIASRRIRETRVHMSDPHS